MTTTAAPAPAPLDDLFHQVTPDDLTEREHDVLRLVTNGYSNVEISQLLHLSRNTVKTYIRSGYRKIGAQTRSHAVVWGARQGLLVGFDPGPRPV